MMRRTVLVLLLCTMKGRLTGAVACPIPNVVLGIDTQNISYAGNHYPTDCSWTIPTSVKGNHYAIVVWLENVTLPYADGGCAGALRLPGTDGFSCTLQTNDCWIYTKEEHGCTIADINATLSLANLACEGPLFWKNLGGDPVTIMYNAANKHGQTKKFTIHYNPINCAPQTTTAGPTPTSRTPASTVSPSLPGVSTTQQTSTTKPNIGSTPSEEVPVGANTSATQTSKTTSTSGTSSVITEPQKSNTTTIIAIIIPIIMVLLLVIGVLVYLRRSRQKRAAISEQQENRTGGTKDEHEMVVNEIYGDTNIDCGPEMVENQIYEQSDGLAMQTTEPDVYAVVVKKKQRKETQSDELHGKSNDTPDNDNDTAGDVYAVIQGQTK